jgi:hypothetical protein
MKFADRRGARIIFFLKTGKSYKFQAKACHLHFFTLTYRNLMFGTIVECSCFLPLRDKKALLKSIKNKFNLVRYVLFDT